MASIKTIVILWVTPFLVALSSQAAMGFQLSFDKKGARDLYIPESKSITTIGNEVITNKTTLYPYKVTQLPRGGTRTLENLLDAYRQTILGGSQQDTVWDFVYPYIRNPKKIPIVVKLDQFTYDYITINGQVSTREIPTYKAHNLILDTTLSIGILGLISYAFLWGYYIYLAIKLSFHGMEVVAIGYLIFAFTWFECAQYAHIPWCALSISGAFLTSNVDRKVSPYFNQLQ
ncbi:hypothetical protein BCD67_16365 [Oscillatoriales cyanobacterium USR001]|nr:hypothetical protein BCD67_16365 [Oscillatoriales cyanobacterium USR001]